MNTIQDTQQLLYLIRLGELCLKGGNRAYFEKRLRNNIKRNLSSYKVKITTQKGRMFMEVSGATEEIVDAVLSKTFGIAGFSRALKTQKSLEAIQKALADSISDTAILAGCSSFKVESRRSDKSFPMDSYGISREVGAFVLGMYPHLRVDVKQPEVTISIEIRDHAYVYASVRKGLFGLPVGTAGKGLLLLSGGIDSPVAGFRMAGRGLRQDAIYFHTYPYTSDEALQKVKDLSSILASYIPGLKLYVIPFTKAQLHIAANGRPEEQTLLMRYAMVKIANMLAERIRALCLVTGESLSQVASQTIESLTFTNSATTIPILRPLIGLDKEEIITTAKGIGTYETSILPYEDCCTIFSPKHPLVRPELRALTSSFEQLGVEALLQEAVQEAELFIPCQV